jgi:hypothetical protein
MVWQKMIAGVIGSGLGKAVGKLVDYIPGKTEARRNRIEKLEKEQDEIKRKPPSVSGTKRLMDIADELGKLYQHAKNSE